MAPKRATRSTRAPPTPNETTTTVTEAQLQALIDQGVAAAMAEAEASRARNGYNSNGSGPRPAQTARKKNHIISNPGSMIPVVSHPNEECNCKSKSRD
ncbi:hypothetical protein Tco_0726084 [Tanacetum coccineum]|uniref:SMP domain-containing protein n=1 Tax=Tanacetum coccineum TaxID=301880 RepID=A0ABQ4YGV6_9ASTR